jgi:hypothetical protein
LNACTDPADRRVAEKAVRVGIVKADPLRAIELAGAAENRNDGYDILREGAEQARKMGPGMSRQLAMIPMKSWMLSSVIDQFADREPELAVDLALKSLSDSDVSANSFSLRAAFSALARRDVEQAMSKLDGLTGPGRAAALTAIGATWATEKPAAALDWLAKEPAENRTDANRRGFGSNDTLLYTFSDWMTSDRGAAQAWADSLPPGETRDKVQIQLARVLASNGDPAEATQVLYKLGRAADPKALSEIAGAWARKDPQAAADWAISQPTGSLQDQALASVVGAWAINDPGAAKDWLSQFPPGDARDRSITAFLGRANLWTESRPVQIAEFDAWFELIDDPWQRALAAQRSYWVRREDNPAVARAWLASLQNVDRGVIRMALRNDD